MCAYSYREPDSDLFHDVETVLDVGRSWLRWSASKGRVTSKDRLGAKTARTGSSICGANLTLGLQCRLGARATSCSGRSAGSRCWRERRCGRVGCHCWRWRRCRRRCAAAHGQFPSTDFCDWSVLRSGCPVGPYPANDAAAPASIKLRTEPSFFGACTSVSCRIGTVVGAGGGGGGGALPPPPKLMSLTPICCRGCRGH